MSLVTRRFQPVGHDGGCSPLDLGLLVARDSAHDTMKLRVNGKASP